MPINVHHEGNVFRSKIQGALAGSCVVALESAWRTASGTDGGNPVIVDLREVASIDAAGRDLLLRMRQAGAKLIASPTRGDLVILPGGDDRPPNQAG
jgi:anti-anti-sigma regulatory factor